MSESQANKPHRTQSNTKSSKDKSRNVRAFAPASGRRAEQQARRNVEKDQTRLHVPLVDRTFGGTSAQGGKGVTDTIPPVIIAVVGPKGVGKSTLVRSLVRRYTRATLANITGPVTVVSGKNRRLTIIECPNDLGAMIDVCKVADLVLLMIDGSFGFEMDTFEALSVLASHGMPKIIGVLTHLDLIKSPAALKAQKKRLKHRFWTEVYDGAKMFYLSGVLNGRYPDREILNLSRFISIAKFRPLVFRNSHSYFLADRFDDITPQDVLRADPASDRTIAVFGYMRGVPLRAPTDEHPVRVHVPGSGADAFQASRLVELADPCPLPTVESEKRRKLGDKNRVAYAPMSGGAGGGVMWDGERVWISTTGTFSRADDADGGDVQDELEDGGGEGIKMVMGLQDATESLGESVARRRFQVFVNSRHEVLEGATAVSEGSVNEVGDSDDSASDDGDTSDPGTPDLSKLVPNRHSTGRRPALDSAPYEEPSREIAYADSDSDLGLSDEDGHDEAQGGDEDLPRWKTNMSTLASAALAHRRQRPDPMRLVYEADGRPAAAAALILRGESDAGEDDAQPKHDQGDDLFGRRLEDAEDVGDDSFRRLLDYFIDRGLPRRRLRRLFVTTREDDDEDADNGTFEDLEANEDLSAEPETVSEEAKLAIRKEELKRKFDRDYDREGPDDEDMKQDFYAEQKDELARRQQATRDEFAEDDAALRALIEGHRPGTYVRLELGGVPTELVDNFDPRTPLIVGVLQPEEESFGFVQARVKKHRWFPKILKTNDPLIFSVGWRRFQTVPIYSLDDGTRNRMLKYTPEHMHCLATFYGPVSAPNTGFCAFNRLDSSSVAFRVSASGVISDVSGKSNIVKKLKLAGAPLKVFKNTAFIKDMFNSALEVAKFEGAQIRTVSGIRGQIKKALSKTDGTYRATFEDKILMSDIVFLRSWYQVQPRRYYNPVGSLLLDDQTAWQGMRLTGEVRRDLGIKTPSNVDSHYQTVVREPRRFNALRVPNKLQAALPFASKPKMQQAQTAPTYMQQRAVVLDGEEKRALALLQQMQAVNKVKVARRKDKKQASRAEHQKRQAKKEERDADKARERSREHFRTETAARKRSSSSAGAGRYAKKQRS